ncbi:hypothetical protein CAEBREN_13258 [Caenorhabditis brenneri]|uniref:Uncharacterized protein n=1 Tax=Caenorhabditis brenneri TaxID=135651 RepID=G0MID5_CAEBE|nr:hypothetical protein CAEBREN_13258 [Caenorhabditis brenneri]
MSQSVVRMRPAHGNNNNNGTTSNKMGGPDRLKRKGASDEGLPTKKAKEEIEKPTSSKTIPTPEIMGIHTPMDPDYRRLPKGFVLGDLAREKFAGIVLADLHDRYEIQIYCRLFEHFAYYPYYKPVEDTWISAHDHAVGEIIKFRTPPSVVMSRARAARNSADN